MKSQTLISAFICTIYICFSLGLFAQKTTISGTIEKAHHQKLRVYAYSDLITYTEDKIGEVLIDSLGNFKLAFNLHDDVNLLIFRLGFFETAIYIEKGKTYSLHSTDYDPNAYNEADNPFIIKNLFTFNIENSDSTELNYIINAFEKKYNTFILDNFVSLIRGRNKSLVNDFINEIEKDFESYDHPYFRTYKTYKIAVIEQSARIYSNQQLFEKYFHNRPIEVSNHGFMTFFNQYFTKYFTDLSKHIKFTDLEYTINELASFHALKDSLGKDSVLMNEYLRELVMTKGLGEIWSYDGFDKKNIIFLFYELTIRSKFPEVKIIAENQKNILTRFSKGSTVKPFELKDINNNTISLNEFEGKYVYLFFWNTSCATCIAEMEVLNGFKTKFPNKLEIIGISLDNEPLLLNYFLQGKSYDFIIAHFNHDFSILDNYQIRNIPFFILFDGDGKINSYPAPFPSSDLFNLLRRIIK